MPDGSGIVARGKAVIASFDIKALYFLLTEVFIAKAEKKAAEQGMAAIDSIVGNGLMQEKVCFFAIIHDCSRLRHTEGYFQVWDRKFLKGRHDGDTAYGFSG